MVNSILINGHQHPEKWLWAFLQMVVNILTHFSQYSFLWSSVFWQLTSNTQHLHNEKGTVDCQQLKRTGGRSPGCSVDCNDFIPTTSVRNMTGGGTWHITIWSWTAAWQGAGTCSPERLIPLSPTATVLGPAVHVGRTWNWALNCGRKRMGPHDWSILSPMAVHQDVSPLSLHAGPSAGGSRGTVKGASTWRLNTGLGATRQEHAEPHGQSTVIDDFIAGCYLN